jgi:hypothetical protein
MPFYRVKVRVKSADPKTTEARRERSRPLIASHGGKDVSSRRPAAAYIVAVFRDLAAAKAFRSAARAAIAGT